MQDNIREIATAPAKSTVSGPFYKVQFRVWTKFDPNQTELIEIVDALYEGTTVLSAFEVTRVASTIAEIDDPDIREQFETIAAAERVLQNFAELPEAVRARLYDALQGEQRPKQLAS